MKPSWILCSVLLASVTAFSVATVPLPAMAGSMAGSKGCPPGLAKKGSCIPPGLRKHWVRGDHIPHDVVYHRVYYDDYRLPRPQPHDRVKDGDRLGHQEAEQPDRSRGDEGR